MTTLAELQQVLSTHKEKRIAVIGTTCTGKTTILKEIPDGVALSDLAPALTKEQKAYIMQTPLTWEISETVATLVGKRAVLTAGKPAFGTVIASNTELIVYMKISDELLAKRAKLRNVQFSDAKTMQNWIEEKITESGLPCIEVEVKE